MVEPQVLPEIDCAVFNTQSVSPQKLLVLTQITFDEESGVKVFVSKVMVSLCPVCPLSKVIAFPMEKVRELKV